MSIKTRLEALEEVTPQGIVLTLDDGTQIEHPGPVLEFYEEATEQISRKRGPLYNAALHTVSATGFGKMHELLYAMAVGPQRKHTTRKGAEKCRPQFTETR